MEEVDGWVFLVLLVAVVVVVFVLVLGLIVRNAMRGKRVGLFNIIELDTMELIDSSRE